MGQAFAGRSTVEATLRRVALALSLAVSALALASGTALAVPAPIATLAPIGGSATTESGPWSISVYNPGPEALTLFKFEPGFGTVSDIVPSSACKLNTENKLVECTQAVAAGTTAQMCYLGQRPVELLGVELLYSVGAGEFGGRFTAGTASSCPVAGFAGGSGTGGGSTTPTGTPTTPAGSTAPTKSMGTPKKCVVPNVRGEKLGKAEKSIVAAHCAVGKVKRSHSRHVKKGYVVSQGTRKGKSIAGGTKIALTVSAG